MTNIDCGGVGYKTPKEIELENQIADLSKKVHILNEANMKLENEIGRFAEASKTIERLQEQIKEANEIIISFDKLVGKLTGTVFQNVLDYYKKYNVDRYKKSGV